VGRNSNFFLVERSFIADAPYQTGDLVLSPAAGAGAGLAASGLMVVTVAALHPAVAPTFAEVLRRIGTMALGHGALHGTDGVVAGAVIQGGLGVILGLLYALCQQRAPAGDLLLVGIFYGVVLWVVSGALSNLPFWASMRPLAHTKIWLLGCCVYGFVLALTATARPGGHEPSQTRERE
jgi:hypothetical protein